MAQTLAIYVDINVIAWRSRSAQERQYAMKRKTVILSAIVMTAAVIVLIDSARRWLGFGKHPELMVDAPLAPASLP